MGYKVLPAKLTGGSDNVRVVPSHEITMKLNVKTLNQSMQRIGATELLPESLDGKSVTLIVHESIKYNLVADSGHWADLVQMKVPEVVMDPSIDAAKTIDAIVQLPVFPRSLKEDFQKSRILSGELPLVVPVGKNYIANEITIGDVKVITYEEKYGCNSNQLPYYSAAWIKDGQMFFFSGGSAYATKDGFMNKLKELVEA